MHALCFSLPLRLPPRAIDLCRWLSRVLLSGEDTVLLNVGRVPSSAEDKFGLAGVFSCDAKHSHHVARDLFDLAVELVLLLTD